MATHSNILVWRTPWTEEPGGLQAMGSHRVGHDLATKPPPPPWQKPTQHCKAIFFQIKKERKKEISEPQFPCATLE